MVGLFFSPKHCGIWGMFIMCHWEYGSFSDKLDNSLPYSKNPKGGGGHSIKSDGAVRMLGLERTHKSIFSHKASFECFFLTPHPLSKASTHQNRFFREIKRNLRPIDFSLLMQVLGASFS